jgi:cleavage and polyadenylation specificity factor subunit 1
MFTVIGTSINKGEDVASRGKAYIFEVIEVVPEPGRPETNHKLKLIKKEDIKGPVCAVTAVGGNLAVAYGNRVSYLISNKPLTMQQIKGLTMLF